MRSCKCTSGIPGRGWWEWEWAAGRREGERGLAGSASARQNDSEDNLQQGSCTFLNLKFKVIPDFSRLSEHDIQD